MKILNILIVDDIKINSICLQNIIYKIKLNFFVKIIFALDGDESIKIFLKNNKERH